MVIFVFGGFWFWLLIALESIYLVSQIDDDDGGVNATVSFVLTLLALNFFGDIPVFRWILANPLMLLGGLAGYLLLGVTWATAKWWFYVTNRLYMYKEKKAVFLKVYKVTGETVPAELQTEWLHWLQHVSGVGSRYHYTQNDAQQSFSSRKKEFYKRHNLKEGEAVPKELQNDWFEYLNIQNVVIAPQVSDNKSKITTWMVYWPWSFFWTMLNDPIRRLFRRLYNNLREFFQKMSDKVFAGVKNDLPGAGQ
jgi:hypothetical protein